MYPRNQVALAPPDGCERATFAAVQPYTSEQQALLALRRLGEIAAGQHRVVFECHAEIDHQLCHSPESIRRALAAETPFIVAQQGGRATVTLGKPGSLATSVMFDIDAPRLVNVVKRIPAPF